MQAQHEALVQAAVPDHAAAHGHAPQGHAPQGHAPQGQGPMAPGAPVMPPVVPYVATGPQAPVPPPGQQALGPPPPPPPPSTDPDNGDDGDGGDDDDDDGSDNDLGPVRQLPLGPFLRLPQQELNEKRRKKTLDNIQKYFDQESTHFRFVKVVGQGLSSLACRVKLRNRWWKSYKAEHFILKRAVRPNQEISLRREKRNLRRLRGAMHIVQPYASMVPIHLPNIILMEDIENGSLWDFVYRRIQSGHFAELPNRLLYRLLMCLVRFCIAMAYPPNGPRGGELQREEIPRRQVDRDNKTQLTHGDMHSNNVLFGSWTADDWEHDLAPIMKLIDLERMGYGYSNSVEDPGIKQNILAIGNLMWLIISAEPLEPNRGYMFPGRVHGQDVNILTRALFVPGSFPNLDPDIRNLVARCLAQNDDHRPTLEELEKEVSEGIRTKNKEYYAVYERGAFEDDEWIKNLLKMRLLNADVEVDQPSESAGGYSDESPSMPSITD
ncbi:hypothetical protein F5Y05DRAFT_411112 [Hypoxylon sp. FL0543]|nr:hypothetical protein F5Y05DRAFT_411112 [Hypoxylon sp. FL0543]